MLPFDAQKTHLICLNLPLGIETVHGVEDKTQFLNFTCDGEMGSNLLAAMDGD